ncbi:MAG: CDP-glucose 4,6-dehydratase [Candidatus Heimdallarchaeota archaeon]|nr:CDP-glucose 4,6-dehydratase [Candidatus Heimdallarchaeota archaeon]
MVKKQVIFLGLVKSFDNLTKETVRPLKRSDYLSTVDRKNLDYRGKNVLVTGHTGFKGSWLVMWLKALGADVTGYSLEPNTTPSIFEVAKLSNKMNHVIGDIRDEEHLEEVFKRFNPEYVFHLASQPIVRESYKDPKYTYETNIMGLVNLFEVVRRTPSVKTVLNITSDKCYENKEWIWGYRENDPLGGNDPYSSSKACSEIVTNAYRKSFFSQQALSKNKVAIASARAGNVVGGGDWAKDRIIPDCIRALTEQLPVEIRNPHAIRPWQHVLEPIAGYLWLGLLLRKNTGKYTSAWNFCPNKDQNIAVNDLVDFLIQFWGEGSWKPAKDADLQPEEAHYLKLDCTKAHHELHWHGLLNIEETIKMTISWYRCYYDQLTDIYDFCLKQIEQYISIAQERKIKWLSSLEITNQFR